MSATQNQRAFAKLTRTLHITGRRDDGLHLLESEMVSLDFADELEIRDGDQLEVTDSIDWTGVGDIPSLDVPVGSENLVVRALRLVNKSAAVRLTKRIPAGAGLGGGSSDAAAIFRWAGVHDAALAASLGSDIPFCLDGGRALVRGVGEQIEALQFREERFILLTPNIAVSTASVYRKFDELKVSERRDSPNDLEAAAVALEPELAWWRDFLTSVTGKVPVLAGSGSTWFVEGNEATDDDTIAELRAAIVDSNRRACVTACGATPPMDGEVPTT